MATGSFYYPATPSGVTNQVNGPWNLGHDLTVTGGAGGNLVGVRFWKIAADTGTHTATIYNTTGAVLLGSQAFTGETASGWQSLTLATPIPLPAGTYRICVNHPGANYGAITPGVAAGAGPYAIAAGGFAIAGAGTAYPTTSFASYGFLIDPIVDGLPATDARASQVLAEVWAPAIPEERVSQVIAEAWFRQIPVTAVVASQVVLEVWHQLPRPPYLPLSSQVV